ncbi:hypothetical protein CTI12_AA400790 [Artemisia annua]|uniref:Uncharacterized protein n=1 Tax=Artemisia annua TaxID=35608 RepID=A0A2U1MB10_ARTAN|nr:hypothetical protein CTI12_AA400790 [Artemisia annua]
MDSSSSYSNYHNYSPANHINLDACDFMEQLDKNLDFYVGTGSVYPSHQMSPGYQGSGHGSYHDSVPNDDLVSDDDDNTVSEEMSLVKPKKRATKAKKKAVEKEVPIDTSKDTANWSKQEEIALCMAWCDSWRIAQLETTKILKDFWQK